MPPFHAVIPGQDTLAVKGMAGTHFRRPLNGTAKRRQPAPGQRLEHNNPPTTAITNRFQSVACQLHLDHEIEFMLVRLTPIVGLGWQLFGVSNAP